MAGYDLSLMDQMYETLWGSPMTDKIKQRVTSRLYDIWDEVGDHKDLLNEYLTEIEEC
jgi:hypothetical protein